MTGDAPRVSFLLGAGASVDAGIPTAGGMVDAIAGSLEPDYRRLFEFMRHTLLAHSTLLPSPHDPAHPSVAPVDIERIFAAVGQLLDREAQPWSPFVTAWHQGLEAHAATQARGARDVHDWLRVLRYEMLMALFKVVSVDTAALGYLRPLVDFGRNQQTLTIATLNYDRTVEEAAQLASVECHTLITEWIEQRAIELPASGITLLKLHGSINWTDRRDLHLRQLDVLPVAILTESETDEPVMIEPHFWGEPAIVFGEGSKLRAEGPFLELLIAWANHLRNTDRLVVIGYSFRDAHINEIIGRWLNAGTRRMIVIDPEPFDVAKAGQSLFQQRVALISRLPQEISRRRVCQIAGTAADSIAAAIDEALT
jgi:hypothetical protein